MSGMAVIPEGLVRIPVFGLQPAEMSVLGTENVKTGWWN